MFSFCVDAALLCFFLYLAFFRSSSLPQISLCVTRYTVLFFVFFRVDAALFLFICTSLLDRPLLCAVSLRGEL